MQEESIESVDQYVRLVSESCAYGTFFRGVGDIDKHRLIPSLGRYAGDIGKAGVNGADLLKKRESECLRILGQEVHFHEPGFNGDDWRLLTLAQHHGLPTRLLDWTFSAMVALFFAVEKFHRGDGAVYALTCDRVLSVGELTKKHPFEIDVVTGFLPPHVTPRARAQSGLFTIHPNPIEEFQSGDLRRFRIRDHARKKIKGDLNLLGIHKKTLFPDLDGLCEWLRWMKFDAPKH